MKILIVNTEIEDNCSSRSLNGIDSAITFELYKKYRLNSKVGGSWDAPLNRLTANHTYSKYTFIDEKSAYIGTFRSMDEVLEKNPFLGDVLVITHAQWLDEQNPEWRDVQRYQYW